MGDAVLGDVAYTLPKELRAFDLAFRLGGEEFLVLLPGATARGRRARRAPARGRGVPRPPGGLHVTMSFGVASASGADALYAQLGGPTPALRRASTPPAPRGPARPDLARPLVTA